LVAHDAPAAAGAAAAAGDADGGKSSPYHGVTWNKQRGGWQVRIKDSGAAGAAGAKAATYTKQFGRSDDDERRAAEHRDEKFREWGVKKAMNFPQAGTDETPVPLQEKAKKGATRGRAEELQPIGEPLAAPVAAPPVAQQAAAEPPVAVLPPAPAAVAGGPAPAIADAGGDGDAKFSRYKGVSWIAASAKWQSKLTRTIPAVEPGGKAKTEISSKLFGSSDADELEAARHYDAVCREWGRKAMNFPQAGTDETQALPQEKAKMGKRARPSPAQAAGAGAGAEEIGEAAAPAKQRQRMG
jgi:hypothetical protein